MTVLAVVGICIVLLLLAFVAPRLSRHPERGVHKTMGLGSRAGGSAPGPIGRLLSKPFRSTSKWAARSAGAGRRGRGKLPV
ncbi:DUF6411 family protein [Conexibacter sp. SYSU D00693]|uniref:DUF6411 family protein n=1 Tax=Conexibacter sp. SYSU D00693 TaxID=2812560 RepID=UPI00196B2063|nr:DUF6411 family protein [Conexibacter sp. SYSU D00693]